jgi:hypothetical protein
MDTVRTLLERADPLADDRHRLEEERARIRSAAVVATHNRVDVRVPWLSRRAVLATGIAGVLGLVAAQSLFTSRNVVLAAVRFELRLAEDTPQSGLIVAQVGNPPRTIYLHPEIILTNDDILSSTVRENASGTFDINIELTESGGERVHAATANHVGRPLAILLDGTIVMAPVVRDPIVSSALITGTYSRAEAERIASGIRVR